MPPNPYQLVVPSSAQIDFEHLVEQRDLLDATELIAQTGHCRWDYRNNRLTSCSLGYARIFNLSVEEVIELQSDWGKSLALIHPEDREKYLEAYYSQQETGNYTVEYRILRNDGETRWLREAGLLKHGDNNEVVDTFAILQDITESKAYQQDLEDQQELARQVESITDIGYFINDEEVDKFLYISPGYARIHGYTVDGFMHYVESVGDNLAPVYHEDRERLLAQIDSYIENGDDNFFSEYRVVRPDGEIIWVRERSKSRLKKNGRVKLTLGVLQDITQKRNHELELQQARDSLEATVDERTQQLAETISQLQQEIAEREIVSTELEHKNAELERFAYTASHDLKAPLVTIKGFLGLLDKDLAVRDMERAAQDMAKVNHAADTMARLLEDLLELSRIGRVVGETVSCNMTEIAQHAVRMVEARIVEQGVEVQIDAMPRVSGDRVRLAEVYQNLVENAVKFMGEQESPRIHIGSVERDGVTCYFVCDNGSGIAPQYHDLVFGLFERLSVDVDGTGVGLALVRRIVEIHGGRTWVESEGAGRGSTMLFTLPEPH
jgi:PAS domain S-box-containing protein